jgi:DHA2 family multidrug resistance protein
MSGATLKVPHRGLLTACIMTANVMQSLDSTIANVSLPYMQGSLSASYDQITWVLTSYVVASAIMTAPVGWLATRFGRKNLHLTALFGFLVASMLCGASQSLDQIVIFRLLQGMFGAALVPLAQATMLDIYPFEQRAQAMAIFGTGTMLGPIMGPTLGGILTDAYSWRWVFYVNVPVGIVAITGLFILLPKNPQNPDLRFDWTGFFVLALGIGAFQMMLDRGQDQDWFNSREIIIEAVLAGLGLYLFVVHMFTAEKPFIPREVFKDRNFCTAAFMMFFVGMVLLASSALLAPYLQDLGGYPVYTAGITMAPRGFGTMMAMLLAGRVIGARIDQRKLVAVGLCLLSLAMYNMSNWTPDVPQGELIANLILQGFSVGIIFNPMQVLAFTTMEARLRGSATPMMSLFRNMGSAIGVSITQATLVHNTQVSHADLAAQASPFNRMLMGNGLVTHFLSPMATHSAEFLDELINHQAQIIAYSDDYKMMSFVALPPLILLLLLRRHRTAPVAPMRVPVESHAEAD